MMKSNSEHPSGVPSYDDYSDHPSSLTIANNPLSTYAAKNSSDRPAAFSPIGQGFYNGNLLSTTNGSIFVANPRVSSVSSGVSYLRGADLELNQSNNYGDKPSAKNSVATIDLKHDSDLYSGEEPEIKAVRSLPNIKNMGLSAGRTAINNFSLKFYDFEVEANFVAFVTRNTHPFAVKFTSFIISCAILFSLLTEAIIYEKSRGSTDISTAAQQAFLRRVMLNLAALVMMALSYFHIRSGTLFIRKNSVKLTAHYIAAGALYIVAGTLGNNSINYTTSSANFLIFIVLLHGCGQTQLYSTRFLTFALLFLIYLISTAASKNSWESGLHVAYEILVGFLCVFGLLMAAYRNERLMRAYFIETTTKAK
jgi:hypothetical protein